MSKHSSLLIFFLLLFSGGRSYALNMELLINGKPLAEPDAVIPLQAGKQFAIGFRITDSETNLPATDLFPGAWIRPRTPGHLSCENAVRNYLAQGSNANQDISLNGYTFITVNKDNSIAVMDPRLHLATSNLLALNQLNSRVGNWQLVSDKQLLYLTLPDEGLLVEMNPTTLQINKQILLDHKPTGLAIFSRSAIVWVASENAGKVYVVDRKTLTLLNQFEIGKGAVQFAIDPKNHRLFAYSGGDGQLIAIDSLTQQVQFKRSITSGITGIAYSATANRLYLAHPLLDHLISIEPETGTQLDTIAIVDKALDLQITPDGRWLLAANGKNGVVNLVDTRNGQMTHVLQFKHPFDQIVFSKQYAYIRHTDSANASLIHLPTLQAGEDPGVIEVPFGASAPDTIGELPQLSPVAMLPGGHSVVVANPADRTIFLFMEGGMKVPMNAFKTWTASPVAIKVHDHSLRHSQPGIYQTTTKIVDPGAYEVVFYTPKPLLIRCLPLNIESSKVIIDKSVLPVQHTVEIESKNIIAGRAINLEVSIHQRNGELSRANDLQVLLIRPRTNWQHRSYAKLSKKGYYTVNLIFPESGNYKLLVNSDQLQLKPEQSNIISIFVKKR